MPHPGSDGAPAVGGGGLQIWTKNVAGKAGQGNSYRAVIGFCRKRRLQGLGCTERASRLLSCGEGRFIELEQHTGQKFLPRRSRIFYASAFFKSWLFSLAGGLCKVGAERKQKNPTVAQ